MRLAALVLAGGRGSRMGDGPPKPLRDLGGRPLVAHVLDRLPDAADPVLLSANHVAAFAPLGLTTLRDRVDGYAGPLAGLDAAAAYLAAHRPDATHLLCVPGDTPFLPFDLSERLIEAAGTKTAVAMRVGTLQPAVALWTTEALAALPRFLSGGGKASIRGFLDAVGFETVEMSGSEEAAPGGDPFFNVNTPAELDEARMFLLRNR